MFSTFLKREFTKQNTDEWNAEQIHQEKSLPYNPAETLLNLKRKESATVTIAVALMTQTTDYKIKTD